MIVCGVLTDGRSELLAQTLDSLAENVTGIDHLYLVDDSGRYGPRKGLAGAVQTLWDHAGPVDYLFHLEDDWTFTRPIDLTELATFLDHHPELAQVVLQRQALLSNEHAAGGVAAHPHWVEHCDPYGLWVEQTDIFSLNPCLIPRRVRDLGWPAGNEAGMTERCLAEGYRFAFWGEKNTKPHVNHNGMSRSAGWAL